jgi:ABC-type Fe3+ transport system substrate-binding protein
MGIASRWWAGLAAGGVVILVACGGGGGAAPSAPAASAPASGTAVGGASSTAPASQPAATAPSVSPQLQALIDGARREGSLSFVWGEGTVGGTEGVARLAERFNRLYGLDLNVRFTPGPSMPNMAARIADEYQAGRPATTDVFVGYGGWVALIRQVDALLPVDWASWAANIQDPQLVAANGMAVGFQSGVQGITYNTQRVRADEVPTSLQDLLKPQYKGRVASTPYAAGFDRLPVPELWGEQRTLEYATRFADQITGLIRCNETERVASGEFEIFALDCNQANALGTKAKGGPVGFVVASDAPFVQILYMAVPRHAAHPNAAQLWVNFLLSREAQDMLYEFDYSDYHTVPGSKTAADMAAFAGPSVKPIEIGVDFYDKHDEKELTRIRTEIERIFAKR